MKTTSRRIAGICLAAVGLLLIGYGIYLALTPRIYQSNANIKVDTGPLALNEYQSFGPPAIVFELGAIQSKRVLYPVISNLQSQGTWAEQYKVQSPLSLERVYELLRRKVGGRPIATNLFTISFRSQDRDEAAAIANAIAEEYRRIRIADREERWSKVPSYTNELQALEQQIKGLELQIINATPSSTDTNKITSALKDSRHREEWIQLETRLASDPNNHKIPVQIIDPAVPAARPVYPNPWLMWGALFSGCVLVLSGVRMALPKHAALA